MREDRRKWKEKGLKKKKLSAWKDFKKIENRKGMKRRRTKRDWIEYFKNRYNNLRHNLWIYCIVVHEISLDILFLYQCVDLFIYLTLDYKETVAERHNFKFIF